MSQNNDEIENLYSYIVRSYVRHINDSRAFINQSLHTFRRQESAYTDLISQTFQLLNETRNISHQEQRQQRNIQTRRNSTALSRRNELSDPFYQLNPLSNIDSYPYRSIHTPNRRTSRAYYNNIRNAWSQLTEPRNTNFTLNYDFEDVVVNASERDISNATHIIRYGNITQPQNQTCPISLTPFDDDTEVMRIRYCGHLFVPNELQRWFEQNVRCPLCRYDIRTYNSNYNSSLFSETPDNSINENNSNENNQQLLTEDENDNIDSSFNGFDITRNNDGSLVYRRNVLSTNINDIHNELDSFFNNINQTLINTAQRRITNGNTINNNMISDNITNDISNNDI